ncbi:hypothetical protein [Pseudomonas sp. BRG-100]|uniref:hypothetical protein n=1 Tax=Pseudomonas sp. BRG-100 TaxID=1524267 RepID=UPI0013DED6C8|nr:hypothetical protein [Pseudomonas sp. BRG-100]
MQRDLILFQHQAMLNAELDLSVVTSSIHNLLTVLVVYRSVVAGAALAWRSLNRITVALVAAVGAVWVWHRLALGCFPNANRSGWASVKRSVMRSLAIGRCHSVAVFALNDTNAVGESTLNVEPVCLGDAGGQALVGKHLQLTAPCDVNYFVHRLALASCDLPENLAGERVNVHVRTDCHRPAVLDVAAQSKV